MYRCDLEVFVIFFPILAKIETNQFKMNKIQPPRKTKQPRRLSRNNAHLWLNLPSSCEIAMSNNKSLHTPS